MWDSIEGEGRKKGESHSTLSIRWRGERRPASGHVSLLRPKAVLRVGRKTLPGQGRGDGHRSLGTTLDSLFTAPVGVWPSSTEAVQAAPEGEAHWCWSSRRAQAQATLTPHRKSKPGTSVGVFINSKHHHSLPWRERKSKGEVGEASDPSIPGEICWKSQGGHLGQQGQAATHLSTCHILARGKNQPWCFQFLKLPHCTHITRAPTSTRPSTNAAKASSAPADRSKGQEGEKMCL